MVKEKNKGVKAGLARYAKLGATAARVGTNSAVHAVKRPFLTAASRGKAKERLDGENARAIFEAISSLKGAPLKIAQMLSMETDMLPERYRREFAKASYQVEPMNRAVVRGVFMRRFGAPPENIFREFDYSAPAAASLGQVHRATLPDGRRVAVKIQYPGIRRTIMEDVWLVKAMVGRLPIGTLAVPYLEEIRERLIEETDYRREAKNLRWFRDKIPFDGIEVPEVFADRCADDVLVLSYIEGKHIAGWLADNPPREVRDAAAQKLFNYHLVTFYEHRAAHADPNPGNYFFRDDGSVGIVDFGCVKRFGQPFAAHFRGLMAAIVADDFPAMMERYRLLGVLKNDGPADLRRALEKTLISFSRWVAEPYLEERYDFAKHPGYCERGRRLYWQMASCHSAVRGNPDFVFMDRTWYGLFRIFEKLGAAVHFSNAWEGVPSV